ncbi:MAG: ABC transporter permease [Bacillota bacterium]
MEVLVYIMERSDMILVLFLEHLWLILVSIGIAIVIGVFLGVLISYFTRLAPPVLTACQILMTVPSIAMLGLLLPFFGIGFQSGVIALILYSLLPIVRNTYSGIEEIPDAIIESAKGMGMKDYRILFKIKLPLAFPVIMAGVRTATVMIVGIGAIAAYIGAGGLGELIFNGISRTAPPMIITGALFVSIIAVAFDLLLSKLEKSKTIKY